MKKSVTNFFGKWFSTALSLLLLILLLHPLNVSFFRGIRNFVGDFAEKYSLPAAFLWYFWITLALVFALWLWKERFIFFRKRLSGLKNKKVVHVTAGWSFWASTSWMFDNLLYPAVIAWLGLVWGGAVMTFTAILITFFMLIGYDRSRTDWLGIDSLDVMKDEGLAWVRQWEKKRYRSRILTFLAKMLLFLPKEFFKLAAWMLERGGALAFTFLSFQTDPFITTAYFRRGKKKGLRRKDWVIFFSSGLLGNIYWSLRSYGLVVVIQYFWRLAV